MPSEAGHTYPTTKTRTSVVVLGANIENEIIAAHAWLFTPYYMAAGTQITGRACYYFIENSIIRYFEKSLLLEGR